MQKATLHYRCDAENFKFKSTVISSCSNGFVITARNLGTIVEVVKGCLIMKVVLQLGAHRTGNTSFHHYLSENKTKLQERGIAVWGPDQTRNGLLTGVIPVASRPNPAEQFRRAKTRIKLQLAQAEAKGYETLLVSDENMIGAARSNLREERLYAAMGERMARFFDAFCGRITSVGLSIRAQDTYWASAMAYGVARGHKVPSARVVERLGQSPRFWRDVITDLACAMPDVALKVLPFETFAALPEMRLATLTGQTGLPTTHAREWLGKSPDLRQLRQIVEARGGDTARLGVGHGRWQPFTTEQASALREAYADDLFWLRAGADGLATLTEETWSETKRSEPQQAKTTRGRNHGNEDRRLA